MSHPQAHLAEDEQANLSALLKCKLQGIPHLHIPTLTLVDILQQTPRALHFPNIPPDLQLDYFLRNRALMTARPIKNEAAQALDVTRAIWYYRLDSARQFQRYHDTFRWNMAIFTALLCLSPHSSLARDTSLPRSAHRFMTTYIAAVLEHHNTPSTFSARDAFIKLWKGSVWDVFDVQTSAQKKLMKKAMKVLTREWERVLDDAWRDMGREGYHARVARFVGCVLPGRQEQGGHAAVQYSRPSTSVYVEERRDVDMRDMLLNEDGRGLSKGGEEVRNVLLEALRVPLGEQEEPQKKIGLDELETVTDIRHAITAVQRVRPRDMLPVLMRLFDS